MKPLAIYYEHPDWFKPLIAELDKRQLPHIQLSPNAHAYDLSEEKPEYSLLFNRTSPSAYLRQGGQGIFFTLSYLRHLEQLGLPVVNGSRAFQFETSKASQLSLVRKWGLSYPRAIVINHLSQVLPAAKQIGYPLVIKANIGGSGAGITRYDTAEALQSAVSTGDIDFGIDATALVQEFVPARGGFITRVETLGGRFLYAIRVYSSGDSFNLCPADICQTQDGRELLRNACAVDAPKNGLRVEAYTPPPAVIAAVEQLVQSAGIDVGGIEYFIDDRDGRVLYYDINALSNFVADAPNVIGFQPHESLVNYLEKRAGVTEGQIVQQHFAHSL